MEPSKSPFQSKTLWVSLILAVAAFFPPVQEVVTSNPELVGILVGGVFTVLRMVTKGKIGLK